MSKNQKKLYTGIFIAILFVVFIMFSTAWKSNVQVVKMDIPSTVIVPIISNKKPIVPPPAVKTKISKIVEQETKENTESVTVLAGNTKVNLSFQPNTFLYDALIQAKETGKISFSGKNYPGLGFFVTDIGTLQAGDGKHLIYFVNGKEATVGVSSYRLKDGDIIEWKLE